MIGTTPARQHYDLIIVGAGMVGATLACAVTHQWQKPLSVLVIEASRLLGSKAEQPGFDARSTVLSASSVDYLQMLGLWEGMQMQAAPIQHIQVSDQGHFGGVHLHGTDSGVDALGQVVENAVIGQALNRALLQNSRLELCAPVQVEHLVPHIDGMQLRLSAASSETTEAITLTAALVVLAEGGRSGLAQQLGIHTRESQYGQSAVIANVALSQPHRGIAYERFTAKGPLALLPLVARGGMQRMALVWTHPEDDIPSILALPDADFIARLQQDCGNRVGQVVYAGKRAVYPLSLQVAEEQFRPGVVLLGNVAHTLHPVAGQGFNLALRDAMALAANIRQSCAEGVNPGTFARLRAWWDGVQQDQARTITFSDAMTRIFSSRSTSLTLLRKFGMVGLELLPPLKRHFAQQAMGYASPGARLN
jgi:2-octaprenyl-6-methoxyphenol hydroxylase